MCGIAGFCLSREDNHLNARKVSMALLQEIVKRGNHATGASWVKGNKETKKAEIVVSKAPVSAYQFEPYLAKMPAKTTRAILHTRFATQGSPQDNLNNHPIVCGRIVGAHNGVLSNDNAIFDYLNVERKGEVDSEAAFALLNRTIHSPAEVLQSLKGRASLCWFDSKDKRNLHLARVEGSPLAIGQTEGGSLFFASTMQLLVAGCDKAGVDLKWVEDIEPMTYMKIRNGEILELETIGKSLKAIA